MLDRILERAEQFKGLRPRAWLCVGPGFAREEIKAGLLARGIGLTGEAITSVEDLCLRIVPAVAAASALGSAARQEVLRVLLAEPRISAAMPELKKLRRQAGFFRKLDRAVQAGRLACANASEAEAFESRLRSRIGPSPVRDETRALARAYEAWMSAQGLWDPPLLLREATRILREEARPGALPQRVVWVTAQRPESLEQDFWDALATRVELDRLELEGEPVAEGSQTGETSWERWHTCDDAAERLADALAGQSDWSREAILIPDVPSIRRSVRQALHRRGIPLADPRDPTRLRSDEGIKWAMSPLEVAGRSFERVAVLSWARAHFPHPELERWFAEIHARGVRQGLGSYSGGKLALFHQRLCELRERFAGKRTAEEFRDAHLTELRMAIGEDTERFWLLGFFERFWSELVTDMGRTGQQALRAPLRFWLERLQARLEEATPPVERFKPREGVFLHRLGQAPVGSFERLWIVGYPAGWLAGESCGDYFYSERERELLGAEFPVRSAIQGRQERAATVRAWLARASRATWLDASYSWDGRELETIAPDLRELGCRVEPREMGAHPRWVRSYGALRPLPPLEARLRPLSELGRSEIQATELENYSRCGFWALASSRWRIRDLREPETDLWADARGNILHAAIRILLENRSPDGQFLRSPADALDEAWNLHRPKGLLQGERLRAYARARLVAVLDTFTEQEREYVARSGAAVRHLEGPALRLELEGISVVGVPDRIDEHPDGLFVMDYKTSSQLPTGRQMTEKGYRMQLPFYAIAASRALGRPTLGVQFVELSKTGGRRRGIFLKAWNGKEPGKLTNTTARSASLLELTPADAWSLALSHLERQARAYAAGEFRARPTVEAECKTCYHADFCGLRRLGGAAEESGEGEP